MMEKHGSPAFFGGCTFGGGVRGVKQPDLKKSSELLILIEGVCNGSDYLVEVLVFAVRIFRFPPTIQLGSCLG